MSHPLDRARAKLDRAEEHFETLGSEWQAFLDTEPYGIRLNRDLQAQAIWVFFEIRKPIPLDICWLRETSCKTFGRVWITSRPNW